MRTKRKTASAGCVDFGGDWVPVDDIGVIVDFGDGKCRVHVHAAGSYVLTVPPSTVLDAMARAWKQRGGR